MVRSTRAVTGAALLGALVVLAGCAGSPCADPCDPCDPCAPATVAANLPGDLPEAQAGEAWCRVWVPPEYATVAETVCVKPATKRCIQIPPKYGVRPKLVCVEPAQLCEKIQPAVFATKKRQVMVCPEREEIQRVCCPPSQELDPCEVQTSCYTKVVHPARYETEECPVCISPERRCVEYRPARYQVVPERFVEEPARVQEVCDPARFETRMREVQVRPGRWEWRRNTNCEVPAAPCPPTSAAPSVAPVAPMPAPAPAAGGNVSLEIMDRSAEGTDAGAFAIDDTVRYDVVVKSPAGADQLRVVFTLPAELEFVEGNGGVAFEGEGQSAQTEAFDVPAGGEMTVSLFAKVIGAPATNQVELSAAIVGADGAELAAAKERTQLKP